MVPENKKGTSFSKLPFLGFHLGFEECGCMLDLLWVSQNSSPQQPEPQQLELWSPTLPLIGKEMKGAKERLVNQLH